MLSVIKESYVLFLKKLPLWVAVLLPMAVFSYIDEYYRSIYEDCWSIRLGGVMVVALTELFIFKFAAQINLGNIWQIVKKAFLISVYQIVVGLIMMLPVIIAMQIASHHNILSNGFLFISFIVNIFLGGYFFAKYNMALPLIAVGEKISLANIKQYAKGSYKEWCWVSFLLYFPYVCSLYLIDCVLTSIILSSLFIAVFSIFNILYYQTKK